MRLRPTPGSASSVTMKPTVSPGAWNAATSKVRPSTPADTIGGRGSSPTTAQSWYDAARRQPWHVGGHEERRAVRHGDDLRARRAARSLQVDGASARVRCGSFRCAPHRPGARRSRRPVRVVPPARAISSLTTNAVIPAATALAAAMPTATRPAIPRRPRRAVADAGYRSATNRAGPRGRAARHRARPRCVTRVLGCHLSVGRTRAAPRSRAARRPRAGRRGALELRLDLRALVALDGVERVGRNELAELGRRSALEPRSPRSRVAPLPTSATRRRPIPARIRLFTVPFGLVEQRRDLAVGVPAEVRELDRGSLARR